MKMTGTSVFIVQAAQIAATAIGTYLVCFAATDARVYRTRKEIDHLREVHNRQGKTIEQLEADCYAMKRQRERDLERWSDGLAASFGTELEDVTDRLMDAVQAYHDGEDVTGELYGIHGDLCMVVGDMLSMGPSED